MLLVDGSQEEVSSRLTRLVGLPDVTVSPSDRWMPYGKPVRKEDGSWDTSPSDEAILSKLNKLVPGSIRGRLRDWWLAVPRGANAPNWDIASTCTIKGKSGLLLVEAKAHTMSLSIPLKDNFFTIDMCLEVARLQTTGSNRFLQTEEREISNDIPGRKASSVHFL